MLGTGIYTPADAAALLKAPPAEIRRWAFGYERTRRGEKVWYDPLIRTDLPEIEGKRALTFVELVELMFIKGFREAGVAWNAVHEAAAVAARIFESGHPFAMRRFFADPTGVYASLREADGGESLVRLAGAGQHVFERIVRPYLGQLEFDPLDAPVRWWPKGKQEGVLVDPAISFGAPLVEEVGIPTRTLAEALAAETAYAADRAMERVTWSYRVQPRHVLTAARFETWLMAA